MEKWTTVAPDKGFEFEYRSSGSGQGINQLMELRNDFGAVDIVMTEGQFEQAKEVAGNVIHVPISLVGFAPCYNVAGAAKPLRFTGPVLADIYLGKITRWNAEPIAILNPGVKLPDLAITAVYRVDASSANRTWTEYLSAVSPEWKEKVGVHMALKWPVGVGVQRNEGVAALVTQTHGAIGFVDLFCLQSNKELAAGQVMNKAGEFVAPTVKGVTAAAARLKKMPDDLRFSLVNADGKDTYPIASATWVVAFEKQPAHKLGPMKTALLWMIHDGQDSNEEFGLARLPTSVVEKAEKVINKMTARK
jgi:phosphate transport system substrate-binding protein